VAIIDYGKLLVVDTPEALKASVGAGDVVEINLEGQNGDTEAIQKALALHKERVSIEFTGNTLILRALDIVQMLPSLMESLELAGLLPGEIRLRENTLEDVFIQLTGRRLRE
jgi:ABC-2 type transport system ATP-binding protein